jgi:hypothetical protein
MQAKQREIEETLLGVFGQVLQHAGADGDDRDLGRNVCQLLAERGGVDVLDAQFHAVTAFHNDNYLPLMWPIHSIHRSALFRLLDLLRLESSTRDTRLLDRSSPGNVLDFGPNRLIERDNMARRRRRYVPM